MSDKEVKNYTSSNLSRYKNTNNGEFYKLFLSENGYSDSDFEKKSVQEQGEELNKFFKLKSWKLERNSNKIQREVVIEKDDYNSLAIRILKSYKCNDSEKVELAKKALMLGSKEKELAKLQEEIDTIRAEINAVI